MNDTGTTHQFTLPDSHPDADPHAAPLPMEVTINDGGVTISARDPEDIYSCDVFIEHYAGQLVIHVAGADNPDEHSHHIVLGDVVGGRLVPVTVPAP